MTKEEIKDQLVDKYYAEDAMCKSDLFDMLVEYEQLQNTSSNSDNVKPCFDCVNYKYCYEHSEYCFNYTNYIKKA